MFKLQLSSSQIILLIGDTLVIMFVTLYGGVTHGTLQSDQNTLIVTGFSWWVGWMLLMPFVGYLSEGSYSKFNQLWRPLLGMLLASPIAGFIRGVILNTVILPLFVMAFGGVVSVSLFLWRFVFAYGLWRKSRE